MRIDTLPDILYNQKILRNNLFTLCLSQTSGFFSLGEINKTLHLNNDINYVSIKDSSFYSVELQSIVVNEQNIEINNKSFTTIIDSGTTLSYFPQEILSKIESTFENICKHHHCGSIFYQMEFSKCFEFRTIFEMNKVFSLFPDITFKFENGVEYIWEPLNYMYIKSVPQTRHQVACFGFNKGNSFRINLGSTWMHNHDIIFDKTNQRIGFTKASCNSLDNSNNKGFNLREMGEVDLIQQGTSIYFWLFSFILMILLIIIAFLLHAIYSMNKGYDFYCLKKRKKLPFVTPREHIRRNKTFLSGILA